MTKLISVGVIIAIWALSALWTYSVMRAIMHKRGYEGWDSDDTFFLCLLSLMGPVSAPYGMLRFWIGFHQLRLH